MRKLENNLVSVLVYFTDFSQIQELDYSLLTLIGQWHRPLEIRVLCAHLSDCERDSIKKLIVNYQDSDQFSVTVSETTSNNTNLSDCFNVELEKLKGRYVSFIRVPDYLYPNAYQHLLEKLEKENAEIAFGSIVLSRAQRQPTHLYYIDSKTKETYNAKDIKTVLDQPFYPIHSILIDRNKLSTGEIFFASSVEKVSICSLNPQFLSQYKVSFLDPKKVIGETIFSNDDI